MFKVSSNPKDVAYSNKFSNIAFPYTNYTLSVDLVTSFLPSGIDTLTAKVGMNSFLDGNLRESFDVILYRLDSGDSAFQARGEFFAYQQIHSIELVWDNVPANFIPAVLEVKLV